jgi:hypothetical protein
MATQFITGNINKLAHKIRKAYPSLTWGQCFRFALRGISAQGAAEERTSVFGDWTLPSQRSLAGHFWALSLAYRDLEGDAGRAYKFKQVAGLLYSLCDEGITMSFGEAVTRKGWGESIHLEMIEAFVCGLDSVDTTDRMMALCNKHQGLGRKVARPVWTF